MRIAKLVSIASVVTFMAACNDGNVTTDRGPGGGDGATDVARDFAPSEVVKPPDGVVMPGDGKRDTSKPPDLKPPKPCLQFGAICSAGGDCCSTICSKGQCQKGPCLLPGGNCNVATDCCTLNCTGGKCSSQCLADGATCTVGGAACCSTLCVSGKCQPVNPTNPCKTSGNPCTLPTDCCSGVCGTDGKCPVPAKISFCTQTNDICTANSQCCTGACTGTATKAGYCAALTVTSSRACWVDGTICSGCTGCCSSYCAPYGISGPNVCQPASGCHVTGDLCKKDTDCCGGDPTQIGKIPGGGLIRCVMDPTYTFIGTCSDPNPTNCPVGKTCGSACVPEGDVCHSKEVGACPSNTIRNDCCDATGNKGMCKLDRIGIPRCYGLTSCVPAGGDCAFAGDCCNNLPCLPDANGHLKCSSISCVKENGVCTTTGDCCTGLLCLVPPGALGGICTNPAPPPPPPPPPDAGVIDRGPVLDKVPAPDKPPDKPPPPPPPPCAYWGQSCSTTVACCLNQGNCLGPAALGSKPCVVGELDCTCYNPIP